MAPGARAASVPLPVQSSGVVSSIDCVQASNCLAVGGTVAGKPSSRPVLLHLADGKWKAVGGSSTFARLQAVSCSGADDCEMVGQTGCGQTYAAGWRGGSFITQAMPEPYRPPCAHPGRSAGNELDGVSCPTATFCMAVGYNDGSGPAIVLSFNGRTWSRFPAPPASSDDELILASVSCASADACAVGGEWGGGNEFLAWWNGRIWTEKRYQDDAPQLYLQEEVTSISCTSARFCFTVGTGFQGGDFGPTPIPSFYNVWNGRSWSSVTEPAQLTGTASAVSCTQGFHCTLVGSGMTVPHGSGKSGSYVESYNEGRWSTVTNNLPGAPAAVSCVRSTCSVVGVDAANGESYAANGL